MINTQTDFNTIMNKLFTGNLELLKHVEESDFNSIFDLAKERENNTFFIKLLKEPKIITLKAYSQTENFWQAKKLFHKSLSRHLSKFDEPQKEGPEMKLKVSEIKPGKEGIRLDRVLDEENSSIWIPQNRIVQIIKQHGNELIGEENKIVSLFYLKMNDNTRFAVHIYRSGGVLRLDAYPFERLQSNYDNPDSIFNDRYHGCLRVFEIMA